MLCHNHKYCDWSSPRSEAQASGWCCMHSTFLQILLIFSLPEGYRLQFFYSTCIYCVYGMALYWPTLQFYVCTYVSFVCRYIALTGECYYNTLLCCDYFSSLSVVSRAFFVLRMYSQFGHHPHPLGYLSTKFRFFCSLHCWASPQRNTTQSLKQSPSQLIWCPRNRSLCFGKYNVFHFVAQHCFQCIYGNVSDLEGVAFNVSRGWGSETRIFLVI